MAIYCQRGGNLIKRATEVGLAPADYKFLAIDPDISSGIRTAHDTPLHRRRRHNGNSRH